MTVEMFDDHARSSARGRCGTAGRRWFGTIAWDATPGCSGLPDGCCVDSVEATGIGPRARQLPSSACDDRSTAPIGLAVPAARCDCAARPPTGADT